MLAVRSAILAVTLILTSGLSGAVVLPTEVAAQSLKETLQLHQDADKLYKQGRYAEAEKLYKRALAIYEQVYEEAPELTQVFAVALNNLGEVYRAQRRYHEAELLHRRALAIKEKVLGPEHDSVVTSLNNLAQLYREQGRYVDLEPLYRRLLAINEKRFGPDHPNVATAIDNLATVHQSLGKYAEAEALYRRALAIEERVRGPSDPEVAITLSNLAVVYNKQARYDEAEALYKRAVVIAENAPGASQTTLATTLNNLANVYQIQSKYGQAETLYKRALVITEKLLGANSPEAAQILNSLGVANEKQHKYAEAEGLHRRALAINEKVLGGNHPEMATTLNNLAVVYEKQDKFREAEALFRRALAINEQVLGPSHTDVASTLNNLASLYDRMGRYSEAERAYERSIAIDEKALGPSHPAIATTLHNIGNIYRVRGKYGEAEALYKRALLITEQAFGPDDPHLAMLFSDLAELYNDQGRYGDSLPIIERTMVNRESEKKSSFPAIYGAEKIGILDQKRSFAYSYKVLQFAFASAAANAITKLGQRFAAGTGELATLVRRDQDLAVEVDRLDQMMITAVSKLPNERNQGAEDKLRKRLADIKIERDQIQSTMSQKFPDYLALSKPQPLTLSETQELIDEDEAVVAFDVGDNKSYAWVVTKSQGFWTEIPTNSKAMNEQVQQLRHSLDFVGARLYDTTLAYELYQQIFGSIKEKIAGKKRLSIVANGALSSIPFGFLITSDPTAKSLKDIDWFIRSYAVAIIPSVYSLKTMRAQATKSNAPRAMIAFADPVFSKSARARLQKQFATRSITSFYRGTEIDIAAISEYLPQLPGTRKEVQGIAVELKADPRDIRLGLAATETAVKQAKLNQYRIVYFATHGLVAGDLAAFAKDKAEPALALTIPQTPTELDDGLLTASEVSQLKLDADWVVLSACNTAAEEKPGAEALSGLARAFFYAGARSLIVSHWSVDDEAAAKLMVGTFRASFRDPKLSHAEALQQSMLSMIGSARTDDEANPRLWAPFVVVGEPKKQN